MFAKVKNKKGFTLVELIVVLVILAILAALLVPALTGYIDKAKEKKIVAETRMVVMAVQTVASETYGQLGAGKDLSTTQPGDWAHNPALGSTPEHDGKYMQEIKKLAEVFDSNPKATFYAEITWDAHIKTVMYNNGAYTCTYTTDSEAGGTGSYKVEKSAGPLPVLVTIDATGSPTPPPTP